MWTDGKAPLQPPPLRSDVSASPRPWHAPPLSGVPAVGFSASGTFHTPLACRPAYVPPFCAPPPTLPTDCGTSDLILDVLSYRRRPKTDLGHLKGLHLSCFLCASNPAVVLGSQVTDHATTALLHYQLPQMPDVVVRSFMVSGF